MIAPAARAAFARLAVRAVAPARTAAVAVVRPVAVTRVAAAVPRDARAYTTDASNGLSGTDITARILDVLKSFDKVQPDKVCCSYRVVSSRVFGRTGPIFVVVGVRVY